MVWALKTGKFPAFKAFEPAHCGEILSSASTAKADCEHGVWYRLMYIEHGMLSNHATNTCFLWKVQSQIQSGWSITVIS